MPHSAIRQQWLGRRRRLKRVLRVLPRVNDDVNEEWASDKTRHAVDGLVHRRIDRPYVRKNGKLVAVKVGTGVIHYLIARRLYERNPRAAHLFETISIGIQGGIVAANLRFAF